MAGGRRVDDAQYAGRVNAAADLLEAGVPVSEAARALAGRFGVSARQARRYAGQAARRGRVAVPEKTAGVTVQLPVPLAGLGRARAPEGGGTISAVGGPAPEGVPGRGRREHPRPCAPGRTRA